MDFLVRIRNFLAPSGRGLRPQAVGERTVRLPEIFRAMASPRVDASIDPYKFTAVWLLAVGHATRRSSVGRRPVWRRKAAAKRLGSS